MDLDSSKTTITTALTALHKGETTALAITEACLRRIGELNGRLDAFLTPTPELAVQAAIAADAMLGLRPSNLERVALLGIPIGIKDLFETAGIATTAGAKFFRDNIPSEDSEAVLRLKLGGAAIVGKTHTHEIALGVTGINPHYGTAKNPWNEEHIAGGSSSGSAVAVATGMCLGALGTDTGGSTRIPASLCGIVGLKPTRGRISTRGVMPLSWNLDHVGVLTRSVRDAGIFLNVLAGYDEHDPSSANAASEDYTLHLVEGVGGWRIALAAGEYAEACDEKVWEGVQETGMIFKDAGASVEKVDLGWLSELATANTLMTQADAATVHQKRLAEHPDWFGEDVRQRLEKGAAVTSTDYIRARRTQTEAIRRFEMFFEKYDLLVLPTTPITAPRIEGVGALEAARQLTRFTSPFNLSGLPALSVPCGEAEGLPFGVQLVAAQWQEAKVLRAGYVLLREATSSPMH